MAPDNNLTTTETTESRTSRVWLEDGYILHVEVKPGAEVTLEDAQQDKQLGRELGVDGSFGILLDIRNMKSIGRAAREYYREQRDGTDKIKGLALVVGSPLTRIIANFFIGFNKPQRPIQLFNSVEEAAAWLKGFQV